MFTAIRSGVRSRFLAAVSALALLAGLSCGGSSGASSVPQDCVCPEAAILLRVVDASSGAALPDASASGAGLSCAADPGGIRCVPGGAGAYGIEISAPGYASRPVMATFAISGPSHCRCLGSATMTVPLAVDLCLGVLPVDDNSPCTADRCDPPTGRTIHSYVIGCGETDSPPVDPLPMQTIALGGSSYAAYQGSGEPFRLVCHIPCPIGEPVILALHAGMRHAWRVLVGIAGIDVLPMLTPVDVHLTGDGVCGAFDANGAWGFATLTSDSRGMLCLFDYEKAFLHFPWIAEPLDPATAVKLQKQMLFVHEYAHLLFFVRHQVSWESVVRALSYNVAGLAVDPCDPLLTSYSASLPFQLCTLDGFGLQHLAPSLQAIDALYQAGQGAADPALSPVLGALPQTTVYQWRQALDAVIGADTLRAFLYAGEVPYGWLGDAATLSPSGGRYPFYLGRIVLDLPPDAVAAPVAVTLAPVFHLGAIPADWESFALANSHRIDPVGVTFARPAALTIRYDGASIPAGGPEGSIRLYTGSDAYTLQLVPDSTVDTATRTVGGTVNGLGLFMVAPAP